MSTIFFFIFLVFWCIMALKVGKVSQTERIRYMKRIMGIDYGDARTGVAISDLMCSIVGST